MLARYRDKYQQIFSGLGHSMAKTGLTPNMFTLLTFIPAIFMGYFFYIGNVKIGFVFIIISSFFDVLDGNVARATGRVTKFGKVLDHTVDRYIEFILIGGLSLGSLARPITGLFAISGMIMASYARAKAESEGAMNCDIGLMDRSEKLIIVMIGCLAYPWLASSIDYSLVIVGLLSHVTVVQRMLYAKKQLG